MMRLKRSESVTVSHLNRDDPRRLVRFRVLTSRRCRAARELGQTRHDALISADTPIVGIIRTSA
jgi:hypothetical protein